eukprot:810384_1
MAHPPRGRTEKIINGWMFVRYLLIGLYVGVATVLGFVWWFCYYEEGPMISYGQLSHFHACGQDTANGQLYFADQSFDCTIFADNRASTMSLSILVTIEMFNTFNALSENQSLLVNPPWSNIWVVLAVSLSMGLHCMILYVPFFRSIFSTADSNADEWIAVLLISFPVILLDEVLKLISRRLTEAEIRRRRRSNIYSKLSQFSRLEDDMSVSSSSSPLSSNRSNQIWRPSFSFQFAAVSVFKRFYRRIKLFFFRQQTQQTLPYYKQTNTTSTNSSSFLTTESLNGNTNRSNVFGYIKRRAFFYWHRLLSKKQPRELD